jgi:hypothetical protein
VAILEKKRYNLLILKEKVTATLCLFAKQKCGNFDQSVAVKIFFEKLLYVRISKGMNKYVYQIQGALENPPGSLKGLRILVCDLYNFDSVDAPINLLNKETIKYLEFRLSITAEALNIQRLPVVIQNRIRIPLGKWLDQWVLENFYGDTSNRKSVNS